MSTYLRYAGILFLVLVAALVVLPCGTGECDSCVHGRFVSSKPLGRLHGMIARIMTACRVPVRGAGSGASALSLSPPARCALPGSRQEIAPLRI